LLHKLFCLCNYMNVEHTLHLKHYLTNSNIMPRRRRIKFKKFSTSRQQSAPVANQWDSTAVKVQHINFLYRVDVRRAAVIITKLRVNTLRKRALLRSVLHWWKQDTHRRLKIQVNVGSRWLERHRNGRRERDIITCRRKFYKVFGALAIGLQNIRSQKNRQLKITRVFQKKVFLNASAHETAVCTDIEDQFEQVRWKHKNKICGRSRCLLNDVGGCIHPHGIRRWQVFMGDSVKDDFVSGMYMSISETHCVFLNIGICTSVNMLRESINSGRNREFESEDQDEWHFPRTQLENPVSIANISPTNVICSARMLSELVGLSIKQLMILGITGTSCDNMLTAYLNNECSRSKPWISEQALGVYRNPKISNPAFSILNRHSYRLKVPIFQLIGESLNMFVKFGARVFQSEHVFGYIEHDVIRCLEVSTTLDEFEWTLWASRVNSMVSAKELLILCPSQREYGARQALRSLSCLLPATALQRVLSFLIV
jgi:hypothetical protein